MDHIWIDISLFIGCLVETRNYSILSLAFIASSFRVTEEHLAFETVRSILFFRIYSPLFKELTFIFYMQLCVCMEFLFPSAKPSRSFQNLTETIQEKECSYHPFAFQKS